jgi:integrase
VKDGIVDNRRRAAKGLSPKPASGIGAEETCRQALRSLYAAAAKWLDGENGASEIRKPRRPTNDRRALADFELIELYQVTISGGDDPELDQLHFDYGIETGSHRERTYALTVDQLRRHEQLIMLCNKYTIPKPAPVSVGLIERLLAHAAERCGAPCDPSSPSYLPDSPVLHYRPRTDGRPRPLIDRRFDTLHERWQTELPWAREIRVSFHLLRHTMSAKMKISDVA